MDYQSITNRLPVQTSKHRIFRISVPSRSVPYAIVFNIINIPLEAKGLYSRVEGFARILRSNTRVETMCRYVHISDSQAFKDEHALRSGGIPKSKLTLTRKLSTRNLRSARLRNLTSGIHGTRHTRKNPEPEGWVGSVNTRELPLLLQVIDELLCNDFG